MKERHTVEKFNCPPASSRPKILIVAKSLNSSSKKQSVWMQWFPCLWHCLHGILNIHTNITHFVEPFYLVESCLRYQTYRSDTFTRHGYVYTEARTINWYNDTLKNTFFWRGVGWEGRLHCLLIRFISCMQLLKMLFPEKSLKYLRTWVDLVGFYCRFTTFEILEGGWWCD